MGGGGVFGLGNREGRDGRGASSSFEIPGGRGGVKKIAFHRGRGEDFFRNNPFNVFLFHLPYKRNGKQLNVSYWVTEAL